MCIAYFSEAESAAEAALPPRVRNLSRPRTGPRESALRKTSFMMMDGEASRDESVWGASEDVDNEAAERVWIMSPIWTQKV
jgi:hypothetical protein